MDAFNPLLNVAVDLYAQTGLSSKTCRCWNLSRESCWYWNPATSYHCCRILATRFRLNLSEIKPSRPGSSRIWPESGQAGRVPAGSGQNQAKQARFRPESANLAGFRPLLPKSSSSKSGHHCLNLARRNIATATGRCQIQFLAIGEFCVRAKRRKIFSEKLFFWKIISSEIFYDEHHFTSKQMKHKFALQSHA